MTSTEIKAKELVEMFINKCYECDYQENARQSAIICVEELIKDHSQDHTDSKFYYWQEVLTHLKEM